MSYIVTNVKPGIIGSKQLLFVTVLLVTYSDVYLGCKGLEHQMARRRGGPLLDTLDGRSLAHEHLDRALYHSKYAMPLKARWPDVVRCSRGQCSCIVCRGMIQLHVMRAGGT